jgi:hypothetical protein
LKHWKKHNCLPYKLFEYNSTLFNEEIGEVSFSILSHTVLGDTDKSDFSKMQRTYQLQHYIQTTTQQVESLLQESPASTEEKSTTGQYKKKQKRQHEGLHTTTKEVLVLNNYF